jgi:dephospho-CoA kinase
MLRVGLTGGLGSGKSTVAAIFRSHGFHVLEADEIGRALMQPGQPVYREVLARFQQYEDAPPLLLDDGRIDRSALARYVFSAGKLDELSRIVHPATVAEQQLRMAEIFRVDPRAIAVVESALIFEADRAGTAPGLRQRFDKLVLVTAPEEVRLVRYVARAAGDRLLSCEERSAVKADGLRRMAMQMPDEEKIAACDFMIDNSGSLEALSGRVGEVAAELRKVEELVDARGYGIPGV